MKAFVGATGAIRVEKVGDGLVVYIDDKAVDSGTVAQIAARMGKAVTEQIIKEFGKAAGE